MIGSAARGRNQTIHMCRKFMSSSARVGSAGGRRQAGGEGRGARGEGRGARGEGRGARGEGRGARRSHTRQNSRNAVDGRRFLRFGSHPQSLTCRNER